MQNNKSCLPGLKSKQISILNFSSLSNASDQLFLSVFHKHTNPLRSHLTPVHDTEHSLCCGWFSLAYMISQGIKLMTPTMKFNSQLLGEKMAILTNSALLINNLSHTSSQHHPKQR